MIVFIKLDVLEIYFENGGENIRIHQIDRRLQTMVQTRQSLDEILTKLKRMGFENEAKGIKDTRSSKPPQH